MRGGGIKGVYEIGVLKAFVAYVKEIEYAYDVIVGVSIGAMNGCLLSTFERGLEKLAVNGLKQFGSPIQSQPFGLIGIFGCLSYFGDKVGWKMKEWKIF